MIILLSADKAWSSSGKETRAWDLTDKNSPQYDKEVLSQIYSDPESLNDRIEKLSDASYGSQSAKFWSPPYVTKYLQDEQSQSSKETSEAKRSFDDKNDPQYDKAALTKLYSDPESVKNRIA